MVEFANEKSLEGLLQKQLDRVIDSLRDFKIHENHDSRAKAISYFVSRLQPPSLSEVLAELDTPSHGRKCLQGWVRMYAVDKWPLVAYKHTRLTEEEEARVDKLEIHQLLDMIRKECPDRESVLFPSGYDGMKVATMRSRLKNQLRLDLDELTELTQDGSRTGKKKEVVDYLIRIRPGLIKGT